MKIKPNQTIKLHKWIEEEQNGLRDPHRYLLTHNGKKLQVKSANEKGIFSVMEWLKNNNPFGYDISYSVSGIEMGKICYLSYCEKCRNGEDHRKHS